MTEGLQLICVLMCLHAAVGDICNIRATSAIAEPHLQYQSLTSVGGKFGNHLNYIRSCKVNSYPYSYAGLGWGRVNFHHQYGALSLPQPKPTQAETLKANINGGKGQPHQEPSKQGFPSGIAVSLPAISMEAT